MKIHVESSDWFGIIDIQNAFFPGRGGLPVTGAYVIVPPVVSLVRRFEPERTFVTIDRHPLGSVCLASSFINIRPNTTVLTPDLMIKWSEEKLKSCGVGMLAPCARFTEKWLRKYVRLTSRFHNPQMLWADHALVGTEECELVPELQEFNFAIVQYKGMDPLCDSYSGVRDAMGRPTGLAKKLREHGMKRVFLAGLAFDYCVGSTAIDLAYENFETYVIEDLTRSVGVPDGNVDHMRNRMIAAGVKIVRVEDLVF